MEGDVTFVAAVALSRSFRQGGDTTVAVEPATFTVQEGARIALIGPSGSGKSTLLHLMAGLLEPSAGALSWPALTNADIARSGKVAIVFQAPSLVPWLSAVENVMAPLLLHGVPPAEARDRALAALRLFGLGELSDKLSEELSGGQAQRVAIARAAATDARLLLADEPTGQLDQATASEVMAALMEVAERNGAALVVATHDQAVGAGLPTTWRMMHGRLFPSNSGTT
jgi:ABC-type lipoprotein export system ATPase subunit